MNEKPPEEGDGIKHVVVRPMKYSELEDAAELATREWVNRELRNLEIAQRTEKLERQSKLLNCAGLIVFGLIWGFLIAMMIFAHK